MAMLTTSDLLRRVPIFAGLTQAQMSQLSGNVTKQRYKRGESIIEQGQKCGSLFIILSGRARVILTDKRAKEVILATLGPGDCIGEMSLIDGQNHSASVRTDIQTDVLVLSHAEFVHCLAENQNMAFWIMKGLVQRLRKSSDMVSSLALMDVYGRVAKVLMDTAQPLGEDDLVICEKMTRQDIAKMVGASREMVSRVMRDFEDQGFVKTNKDGYLVLQEHRLTLR
jgi:CRP/FNR family transcriptional regulator, cyclic AMP receptor protein